jgi:asparagine synthase (glutamine-hydrolysing)
MCGIAGFMGVSDEGLVERMLNAIRHRGPDGLKFWENPANRLALGHVRLSIIDLSDRGNQPMWDETGRYCITYNGEIYNYRGLRKELEGRGCHFRSQTDTEVLLTLFREKGPACLRELKGIWAFAIWDVKEKILFLSRDPLGVKPLYYIAKEGKFLFSSEIKSFLCWKGFPKDIDPRAVLETMTFLWTPAPRTIFRDVRKLLPGQNIFIRSGRPPELCAPQVIGEKSKMGGTEKEMTYLLQEQLHNSVQSQLVSDVPVGAFLSGGLDSSAVLAMAERDGKRISHCYTIDYAGSREWEGMANDLPYARTVAKYLGVECIEIPLDSSVCDQVPEMIWHLDEPQADLAPLNVLRIAEAARQNGDYVLLSGAGGDDIFSGYRRHVALQNEKWWEWMPVLLRRAVKSVSTAFPSAKPFGRRLQKLFEYADLPADERLPRYFAWVSECFARSLFHDDFQKMIAKCDPFEVMHHALRSLPDKTGRLDKMLFLERRYFLSDHNLNYTDKMGMARGIEIRVPLIDVDLVELAWSIPEHFKLRGLTGKYAFKRAMEKFLPREVIYRPKTGFVAPIREWLDGPLKGQVRDVLSQESIRRRGWFSAHAVDRLFADLEGGRRDVHYTIWTLFTLEQWARLFLDGKQS